MTELKGSSNKKGERKGKERKGGEKIETPPLQVPKN